MNKKALSPLVATMILVVFALVIGAITMNWGKNYVEQISEEEQKIGLITISLEYLDSPLKKLQIDYITNKITLEQYLEKEKEILDSLK
jgi:hypothetical protein